MPRLLEEQLRPLTDRHARDNGLDPDLFYRQIMAESAGDSGAISQAGAQGLGQLMPETAKELGVNDPFDIEQNLGGSARYLRQQLDEFGTSDLALAAYNAGPGNVRKHGGIPPFPETEDYVRKILGQETPAPAEILNAAVENAPSLARQLLEGNRQLLAGGPGASGPPQLPPGFEYYDMDAQPPQVEEGPGPIDNLFRGAAHGTLGLMEGVNTGFEILSKRFGASEMATFFQDNAEFWSDEAKGFGPPKDILGKNIIDNPEILLDLDFWTYGVGDMLPTLLASLIPGMAVAAGAQKLLKVAKIGKAVTSSVERGLPAKLAKLYPALTKTENLSRLAGGIAGGAAGGSLEGVSTYRSSLEMGKSEDEAATDALYMALGSGLLNALSVGKFLKPAEKHFGKLVNHGLNALTEGVTEGLEEPWEALIQGTDMVDAWKQAATIAPIAALTGGGASLAFGDSAEKGTEEARRTGLEEEAQANAEKRKARYLRGEAPSSAMRTEKAMEGRNLEGDVLPTEAVADPDDYTASGGGGGGAPHRPMPLQQEYEAKLFEQRKAETILADSQQGQRDLETRIAELGQEKAALPKGKASAVERKAINAELKELQQQRKPLAKQIEDEHRDLVAARKAANQARRTLVTAPKESREALDEQREQEIAANAEALDEQRQTQQTITGQALDNQRQEALSEEQRREQAEQEQSELDQGRGVRNEQVATQTNQTLDPPHVLASEEQLSELSGWREEIKQLQTDGTNLQQRRKQLKSRIFAANGKPRPRFRELVAQAEAGQSLDPSDKAAVQVAEYFEDRPGKLKALQEKVRRWDDDNDSSVFSSQGPGQAAQPASREGWWQGLKSKPETDQALAALGMKLPGMPENTFRDPGHGGEPHPHNIDKTKDKLADALDAYELFQGKTREQLLQISALPPMQLGEQYGSQQPFSDLVPLLDYFPDGPQVSRKMSDEELIDTLMPWAQQLGRRLAAAGIDTQAGDGFARTKGERRAAWQKRKATNSAPPPVLTDQQSLYLDQIKNLQHKAHVAASERYRKLNDKHTWKYTLAEKRELAALEAEELNKRQGQIDQLRKKMGRIGSGSDNQPTQDSKPAQESQPTQDTQTGPTRQETQPTQAEEPAQSSAEIRAILEELEKQLEAQGRVVDDRLLARIEKYRQLLAEVDKPSKASPEPQIEVVSVGDGGTKAEPGLLDGLKDLFGAKAGSDSQPSGAGSETQAATPGQPAQDNQPDNAESDSQPAQDGQPAQEAWAAPREEIKLNSAGGAHHTGEVYLRQGANGLWYAGHLSNFPMSSNSASPRIKEGRIGHKSREAAIREGLDSIRAHAESQADGNKPSRSLKEIKAGEQVLQAIKGFEALHLGEEGSYGERVQKLMARAEPFADEVSNKLAAEMERTGYQSVNTLVPGYIDQLSKLLSTLDYALDNLPKAVEIVGAGGKIGRETWTKQRLELHLRDLVEALNADLSQPQYNMIPESELVGKQTVNPHNDKPVYGWKETEEGIWTGLVKTHDEKWPSYFHANIGAEYSTTLGIGNTREEAIEKLKVQIASNDEFAYGLNEQVWSRDELEQMAASKRGWHVRLIGKTRGIEGADRSQFKTLIPLILEDQQGGHGSGIAEGPQRPSLEEIAAAITMDSGSDGTIWARYNYQIGALKQQMDFSEGYAVRENKKWRVVLFAEDGSTESIQVENEAAAKETLTEKAALYLSQQKDLPAIKGPAPKAAAEEEIDTEIDKSDWVRDIWQPGEEWNADEQDSMETYQAEGYTIKRMTGPDMFLVWQVYKPTGGKLGTGTPNLDTAMIRAEKIFAKPAYNGKKLVCITCAKRKSDKLKKGAVPASEAYIGAYFKAMKAYAGLYGDDYVILSAEYGFLRPGDPVESYDTLITDRDAVSAETLSEQVRDLKLNEYSDIVLVGGKDYRKAAKAAFTSGLVEGRVKEVFKNTQGLGDLTKQINAAVADKISRAENQGKPLDPNNKFEPSDPSDVTETVDINEDLLPLGMSAEDFNEITNEWAALFANPEEKTITQRRVKLAGTISQQEADQRIQGWIEDAQAQSKMRPDIGAPITGDNFTKVILSLFDHSGSWSGPYVEAGYNVIQVDIQDGHDIMDFSGEYLFENFDFGSYDVYGVLVACPCTDFSSSGSRLFKEKDADGRTEAAKQLVFRSLATIEFLKPKFWALENPTGRIEETTGLPKARMSFDPSHFGDRHQKTTHLWGQFNTDLPLAPVELTEEEKKSLANSSGGKTLETKNRRSETPMGFAYSFFKANNYIDDGVEQRLLWHYPQASGAVKTALKAGLTDHEIAELMEKANYDPGNGDNPDAIAALIAAVKERSEWSVAQAWEEYREGSQPRHGFTDIAWVVIGGDGVASPWFSGVSPVGKYDGVDGITIKSGTKYELFEKYIYPQMASPATSKSGKIEADPRQGGEGDISKTEGSLKAANAIREFLNQGTGDLSWQDLFKLTDEAFGGTQAAGAYTVKDAYDAMEMGVNVYLTGLQKSAYSDTSNQQASLMIQKLEILSKRLPTMSKRTEDMEEYQQFSTPPAYAYLVNWLAATGEGDVVLEPSAGVGSLAIHAQNAGAKVVVNELSRRRAALLEQLGFEEVKTENAEQLDAILHGKVTPDIIVMNPPFSATAGRQQGNRNTKVGAQHVEAALKLLKPNGRLVAIVGKGMSEEAESFKPWWLKIQSEYNVRVNLRVDGNVYRKYGTTFDSQILVIDKNGPTEGKILTGGIETLFQGPGRLKDVQRDRPEKVDTASAESAADQSGGGAVAGGGGAAPGPGGGAGGVAAGDVGPGGAGSGDAAGHPGAGALGSGAAGAAGESTGSADAADQRPIRPGTADAGGDSGGGGGNPDRDGLSAAGTVEGFDPLTASPEDLDALISEVQQELAGEQEADPAPPTKTAGDHLKASIDHAGAGTKNVLDGITTLFGAKDPNKLRSFPPGVDPGTWAKAKPLFDSAWSEYQAAGIEFKEFLREIVDTVGSQIDVRPYLQYWMAGLQDKQPPKEEMASHTPREPRQQKIGTKDATWEDYLPEVTLFKGAQAHPGKLVQTTSMASVMPPKITYQPHLPQSLVSSGGLSETQLEPIALVGQAHSQLLPNGERKGFMLGDGTGVGKGRTGAGIILDNLNQGRRKAVWFSETATLQKDATRDWIGLGQDPRLLFGLKKTKLREPITQTEGVLFTTYASLSKEFQSSVQNEGENTSDVARFGQIVNWLGRDFDGVIIFDEAHKMANAIGVQGQRGVQPASKSAQAGMLLQQLLPQARIVYASATAATEVRNFAYATRLGLWGRGTDFADQLSFIGEIESRGVVAMELIARDMKSLGVYLARQLSYEGVTNSMLTHELTEDQRSSYDTMAGAWGVVLENIEAAMQISGANLHGGALNAVRSQFYGAQQRFFNLTLTALQMPSVLQQMERDLKDGHSVVVQLTETNEAQQERSMGQLKKDETLEDLDLTPRDILVNYVRNGFPVARYEIYTDDNGQEQSRPVHDSEGHVVNDPELVRRREALIEDILLIPSLQLESALDQLLNHFGSEAISEITGRKRRVVRKQDEAGEWLREEEKGRTDNVRDAEVEQFMEGERRILVFSRKGGTGASYHSDLGVKNQQRRMHYVLQAGWQASAAMQAMGRSHRSNEANQPHYYLVSTNLSGHKRFLSSIARRLNQLGALTRGSRDAAGQGLFDASMNLENAYGTYAVRRLFEDAHGGRIAGASAEDLGDELHLNNIVNSDTGALNETNIPPVRQFLNRILALKVDRQNEVFELFYSRLEAAVERARNNDTYDAGMERIRGNSIRALQVTPVHTDEASGAVTNYVELEVEHPVVLTSFEKLPTNGSDFEGFWRNKRSGKMYAFFRGQVITETSSGRQLQRYKQRGPAHVYNITEDQFTDEHFERVEPQDAATIWAAQVAGTSKTSTERVHLITGMLLPIWGRLVGIPRIKVAETSDGERYLGREILARDLDRTLDNLGVNATPINLPMAELQQRIMEQGKVARLANGWELRRRTVSNEPRMELVDPRNQMHGADVRQLREDGAFTESIGYRVRVFIPTGADGVPVLETILKFRPVRNIGNLDAAMAKRTERQGPGMGVAEVEEAIAPLRKAMRAAPEIQVHADSSAMPQFDSGRIAAGLNAAALYDPESNTVHIDASAIPSAEIAQRYLLHEVAGHFGLREVFGADLTPILTSVFNGNRLRIRLLADKLRLDLSTREGRLEAAEELLAELAENDARPKLWARITAKIKSWLIKHGFESLAKNFNHEEAKALVFAARRFTRSGQTGGRHSEAGRYPHGTLRAGSPNPTFYSVMLKSLVESKKLPNKATPADQWLQKVRALAKSGQFTKDELYWSGLEEWLKGQGQHPLLRESLVEYLSLNGVQVEEVVKGEKAKYPEWATPTKYEKFSLTGGQGYREVLLTLPKKASPEDIAAWQEKADTFMALRDEFRAVNNARMAGNYERRRAMALETIAKMQGRKARSGDYTTSHWEEPNVIAHLRLNEREVDGQRVLFVEEAQSDWSLAERKHGSQTATSVTPEQVQEAWDSGYVIASEIVEEILANGGNSEHPETDARNLLGDVLFREDVRAAYGHIEEVDTRLEDLDVQADLAIDLDREYKDAKKGVPAAPFVKDSKWLPLALKRVLRMAAEEGFDRVAWITGKQTAERYSLDKHIDRIDYREATPVSDELLAELTGEHGDEAAELTGEDTYDWADLAGDGEAYYDFAAYDKAGKPLFEEEDIPIERIADLVGKEVAERIERDEGEKGQDGDGRQFTTLKGPDLKVEAKWARNLYDQTIPNWMGKFGKSYGVKVEPLKMGDHSVSPYPTGWVNTDNHDYTASGFYIEAEMDGVEGYLSEDGKSITSDRVDAAFFEDINAAEAVMNNLYEEIEDRVGPTTQQSLALTDQMRNEIMAGLPLFKRQAEGQQNPMFKRQRENATDDIRRDAKAGGIPQRLTDMAINAALETEKHVPPSIKMLLNKLLSNPAFGSEGRPHRERIVRAAQKSVDKHYQIISQLMEADPEYQWPEEYREIHGEQGYLGLEGMAETWRGIKKTGQKRVMQLLKEGDLAGVEYTVEQLASKDNPLGAPLHPTETLAYFGFRQLIHRSVSVRFAQLRELALTPYREQPWFETLEALQFGGIARMHKGAVRLDPAKAQELLSEKQLKQLATHRKAIYAAFRSVRTYSSELQKLKNRWGKLKGYMPRVRRDGDYHVAVEQWIEPEGIKPGYWQKVYMQPRKTQAGADRHVAELTKDPKKHLKSLYDPEAKYRQRIDLDPSLAALGQHYGSHAAIERLLSQAVERAGEKGVLTEASVEQIKQGVVEALAAEIMQHGVKRHGIPRSPNLIEGYEDDNYLRVVNGYTNGLAHWLSRMSFAIDAAQGLKAIPKKAVEDRAWSTEYVSDVLKAGSYLYQVSANLKGFMALWYLGLNAKSAVLNGLWNFVGGQAELSRHTRKGAQRKLLKAQKDVLAGTAKLSEIEQQALAEVKRGGWTQEQWSRDYAGLGEGLARNNWQRLVRGAMTPFQWVETRLNRDPAFLAAFRVFYAEGSALRPDLLAKSPIYGDTKGNVDRSVAAAADFVIKTHYWYAKENRPKLARNPVGDALYVFQGFTHNALLWMYNRARNGEIRVLARAMAALVVLGGLPALPLLDDFDRLLQGLFGHSFRGEFRAWMRDYREDYPTEAAAVEAFVNHGATSVFGVSMTRAMALQVPFISWDDTSLAERAGGAWGGMGRKLVHAAKAMGHSDYDRAAEYLLPEMLSNPLRAARMRSEGATTLSGKEIRDHNGQTVRYTGYEQFARSLGFIPRRHADRSVVSQAVKLTGGYWQERKSSLKAKYRMAAPHERAAIRREVIEFNRELNRSQAKGLVPPLRPDQLNRELRNRPNRRRAAFERQNLGD